MQDKDLEKGYFFHPLIIDNITSDQPAFYDEIFAPVFALFSFKTDQEAINLANSSSYGLSSCIFSENIERVRKIAMKIEAGNVFINEITNSDPSIPNGGVKDSGYGRECYKDGLLEIINRKGIVIGI
jgi:succinate-semialdehyde dehydrogenase/glutarate-semialdehyde dehydrogenase